MAMNYQGTIRNLKMIDGDGHEVKDGNKYHQGVVMEFAQILYLIKLGEGGIPKDLRIVAPFDPFIDPKTLRRTDEEE